MKCAVPDVQRDFRDLDALLLEREGQLTREMETGGGGGHGSPPAREQRLIALAILDSIVPLDIWRERHVTDRVDGSVDRRAVARPETNDASPMKAPLDHLAVNRRGLSELNARARPQLLSGMHQRLPVLPLTG